jgi:hypothetical protein
VAVALSGVDLMQFLVALTLLGVGWNFLYTGGSSLLTQTYAPEEKTRAQGHGQRGVLDHGAHFLRLGRAHHHAGLDLAQPRLAAAHCHGVGRIGLGGGPA